AITTNTNWTAANGPYLMTGPVTVNSGVTLTIQAGTTIYAAPGAGITVASGGRLLASGTQNARIRFTQESGAASPWPGIIITGAAGSPQSRLEWIQIDRNNATAIQVNTADVWIANVSFLNPGAPYIALNGSSFMIANCNFPTATG